MGVAGTRVAAGEEGLELLEAGGLLPGEVAQLGLVFEVAEEGALPLRRDVGGLTEPEEGLYFYQKMWSRSTASSFCRRDSTSAWTAAHSGLPSRSTPGWWSRKRHFFW